MGTDEGSRPAARASTDTRTLISAMTFTKEVTRAVRDEDLGPPWARETVLRVGPGAWPIEGLEPETRALLPHQEDVLGALRDWWQSAEPTGVLCLPTGAGKTRTGVTFALREGLERGSVLWLAHREELVTQAAGAFARCASESRHGFALGRYQAGARKVSHYADVVVASVPTLAASKDALDRLLAQQAGRIGLVVVDECHHAVARTWLDVITRVQQAVPTVRVLGLSATPIRSSIREDRQLARVMGRLVYEASPLELIRRGVLARPRFMVVDTHLTFDANEAERAEFERFGDLPDSVVDRIARDERRNTQIFNTFAERPGGWGPTLFFVATLKQAARFVDEMHRRSIPAAEIRGDMPLSVRRQLLSQFRAGRLDALVNVGVLTEGTDLPGVRTVFIARPTRSRSLFQQMVGRAMRGPLAGGNAECNVVSFYDAVVGLGAHPYSTSFTEERAAWDVVVGEREGEVRPSPKPAPLEEEEPRPRAVGLLGPNVGEAPAPNAAVRLLGWWELPVTSGSPVRLPVFAIDETEIASWVASLVDGPDRALEIPVALTSRRRFVTFAEAFGRKRAAAPTFVALDVAPGTQPEVIRSFIDEARTSKAWPVGVEAMYPPLAASRIRSGAGTAPGPTPPPLPLPARPGPPPLPQRAPVTAPPTPHTVSVVSARPTPPTAQPPVAPTPAPASSSQPSRPALAASPTSVARPQPSPPPARPGGAAPAWPSHAPRPNPTPASPAASPSPPAAKPVVAPAAPLPASSSAPASNPSGPGPSPDPIDALALALASLPPRAREVSAAQAYPLFSGRFATLAEFQAAIERARPPVATKPVRSSRSADEEILRLLAQTAKPLRKAEVMAELGLDDASWTASIKRLVQADAVRCEGRARGARYAITGSGLELIAEDAEDA